MCLKELNAVVFFLLFFVLFFFLFVFFWGGEKATGFAVSNVSKHYTNSVIKF